MVLHVLLVVTLPWVVVVVVVVVVVLLGQMMIPPYLSRPAWIAV